METVRVAATFKTAAVAATVVLMAACSRRAVEVSSAAALPPLGEDLAPAEVSLGRADDPLDRPLIALCAKSWGRTVLDIDLPGLRQRVEFAAFSRMSLRQLQAASGGRLSLEDIARVGRDLRLAESVPVLRPRVYPSEIVS